MFTQKNKIKLPFTEKNKIKLPFTPNLHAEQTACRTKYPRDKIINQCDFGQKHFIDAPISSNMTLLQQEGLSTFTEMYDSGLNSDDVNTSSLGSESLSLKSV
jgi:hypothetical protein